MIAQGTQAWLDARKGRVTGSSAAAILGLSPWQTREDVMRRMVREHHNAPSEHQDSPPLQWGRAMESSARADFEMDLMVTVEDAPFVPFEDWLGASPDGFVGKDGLVELKAPYGLRKDNPPVFKRLRDQPHYECQCQVELFVTGRQWLWFYQWTPFGQLVERVEPDRDWIATNIPRLKQFWAEVQDTLAGDCSMYLEDKRLVIDTPAALKAVTEYDELTEAIERATEKRKDVLASLSQMSGGKDALVAGRKLTLVEKAGAVRYANVVRDMLPGVDFEPYRGAASSFWKLS